MKSGSNSTNNALIDFLRDYVFSQACYLKDNAAGKHLQYCKVISQNMLTRCTLSSIPCYVLQWIFVKSCPQDLTVWHHQRGSRRGREFRAVILDRYETVFMYSKTRQVLWHKSFSSVFSFYAPCLCFMLLFYYCCGFSLYYKQTTRREIEIFGSSYELVSCLECALNRNNLRDSLNRVSI